MQKNDTNIYARCRHRTGLSAEKWAEKIGMSVESVKRYESGERLPSNVAVLHMIEVSEYDALAMQHLIAVSHSLDVLPEIPPDVPLPQAAIALINRVLQFTDGRRGRRLLEIAEDGKVSDAERWDYNCLLDDLQELIRAAYQVRYADDGGGEDG